MITMLVTMDVLAEQHGTVVCVCLWRVHRIWWSRMLRFPVINVAGCWWGPPTPNPVDAWFHGRLEYFVLLVVVHTRHACMDVVVVEVYNMS